MITITLNGDERSLQDSTSVATLLESLELRGAVAVEINRAIVPRSEYPSRVLADRDRVEIVTAVGGG